MTTPDPIAVSDEWWMSLLQAAREAAESAYCPYSKFRVGAAVLAEDEVFTGSNVENASYGLTICAERTAVFNAVTSGKKRIQAIAVTCIDATEDGPISLRMPCGACRQVLTEFAAPDVPVFVDGVGTFKLRDLMPNAFTLPSGEE